MGTERKTMAIYKRGRPPKVDTNELFHLPEKPGEYRWRDKDKNIAYIGETNNIKRRNKQHKKTGRLDDDYSIEYMIADGRSTSKTRRKHEKNSIEKHQPYLNKSTGGEGRPAMRRKNHGLIDNDYQESEFEELYKESKIRGCLGRLIKIILIVIVLFAIGFFVYSCFTIPGFFKSIIACIWQLLSNAVETVISKF